MIESIRDRRKDGKTELEQVRFVQIYLLDVFVAICEQYNLSYWLSSGSLLGAIRHDGYIPWDDDLDVRMPLNDYRKFMKIADNVLPRGVLLQDCSKAPNSTIWFAKLRDLRSFYCEDDTNVKLPCGVFLDIFPLIKAPRLPRGLINSLCWIQYTCTRHAGIAISRPRASALAKIWDSLLCMLYRCIRACAEFVYHILAFVFPSDYWRDHNYSPRKWYIPDEDVFPLKKHTFEGNEYNVPNNSEHVLELLYGNWRQLPPKEKRQYHATIMSATMTPPRVAWAEK